MISLTDVSLRRGREILLAGVDLTVHAGQRLGVVGRNGTGKTSLFALLQGELSTDAGQVHVPSGLTVATVAQENPGGRRAAVEHVLDGDREWRSLQNRLATAEHKHDAATQAQIHERLHAIGGYAARARAARLLDGLGFAPNSIDDPVESFSGGWRMRLNLAQALMCRSDLMLLDEPTNHLDLDAVLWLQDYLARYTGTLLAISHDRDFLDAVATHILHLERQTATLYTGNYSTFEASRAQRLAQQQAAYENQQKQLAHTQAFIERFRAQATKARQAQSRIKQIERMAKVAPVHSDSPFSFTFATPKRLPTGLLRYDAASAGYDGQPVVADIKLTLVPGDRIALLGRNGAGKSTVMRLLAGELTPLAGEQLRDKDLRVGYFAQHQLEQLDHAVSALTHLQRADPDASEQALRVFLGSFDFRGDKALEPIAPFSGGEKARLALALVVYHRPNLLLLDEPTNHLDLEMRHALEMALQNFAGAAVLVSHDRHLIDATCDTLWRVGDGRCTAFDGDLDDYARWLRRIGGGASEDGPPAASAPAAPKDNREQRRAAADRRNRLKPLRDELKRLERDMQRLETELDALEVRLADPTLYHSNTDGDAAELTRRRGGLRKRLDAAEAAWLAGAERLEAAEA